MSITYSTIGIKSRFFGPYPKNEQAIKSYHPFRPIPSTKEDLHIRIGPGSELSGCAG